MGIGRTFQNIRLFRNLTVLDNVLIGLNNEMKYSAASAILRLPGYWRRERIAKERALELLSIFNMENVADHLAGSLPYGAQRRLEIVRALATNPCLLLLDEPAAGMNPSETSELMENIVKIRDTFGIAIMLIEHDMSLVMGICEGIAVLNYGKIIAKGSPEEIKNNPVVMQGMGLAPLVVKDIFRHIVELRDRLGLTVLLVEQNARSALKIADRGYVLENGRVILQGTADELLANRDVQRAYLGRELD